MRTRPKFVKDLAELSLKNIKRLEVKFDPFHPSSNYIREFYQGATDYKRRKTNLECVAKAQVVCDQSDPTVTVQFQDNHKLVINAKHLEPSHIVRIIRQIGANHHESESI